MEMSIWMKQLLCVTPLIQNTTETVGEGSDVGVNVVLKYLKIHILFCQSSYSYNYQAF